MASFEKWFNKLRLKFGDYPNFIAWLKRVVPVSTILKFSDEDISLDELNYLKKMFVSWRESFSGKNYSAQNTEVSPWEQLGITEIEFKELFPEGYNEILKNRTEEETTTEETPIAPTSWTEYTDEQLTDMANSLGISVDELKRRLAERVAGEEKPSTLEQLRLGTELAAASTERFKAEWEARKQEAELATSKAWEHILGISPASNEENWKLREEDIKSRAYEEARSDLLADLEPTDWVQKWLLNTKENPYEQERLFRQGQTNPEMEKQRIKETRELSKIYRKEADKLRARLKDDTDPLLRTPSVEQTIKTYEEQADYLDSLADRMGLGGLWGQAKTAAEGFMSQYGASPVELSTLLAQLASGWQGSKFTGTPEQLADLQKVLDIIRGQSEATANQIFGNKNPRLEIPDWLRPMIEYEPSSVSTTWMPQAITPSGQKWGEMGQTQKELWASYVRGSGGRVEDLLGSMKSQLPKELNLGRRWEVARQF